ncbi:MAG: AmmeMemoRadiSam system radical SAM enzyme [Ignavibacteria bacterium]|nr:AmmeMemoRadiSam system radical SAM enzyme [Ignavibacteria bacterium]
MQKENQLYEAKWWQPEKNKLLCTLCPRYCTIGEGQNGFCFIRKNIDGKLYSLGYGRPTGFAIDPIEKKPLNHFLPGSQILSFGTAGCNLGCKFCQNWTMSKARLDENNSFYASPEEVVQLAKKQKVPSIAFTYNDPTIFGEYVIDISKIAREEKVKSVMVTAGYIDKQARKEIYKYIDAANVDLKAFSETFYHKLTFSHLQNILETLLWLKNETGVWLEITTLLIPGENDSADELKKMIDWILKNLGDEVPLHFTAFHPDFKLLHKPSTPPQILFSARQMALKKGIKYCYTGNIHHPEGQTTFCPKCKTKLIVRDWHTVIRTNIKNNECLNCGAVICGIFS